ncbi:arylalcohol dehydrogenase [Coniophora puteana RWD-64-598 SS2]|uniref:Arylalcohol dehydrogenase n=1 Tax=Coniophora puteana (strain RWD-64-598) TaxID=741705 RepID=A0A5M3MJE1_CONPW|nr:arylalcohol dehydrogenase [Coniophora puteana RWD-64-598 SS2]EIW79233.1 arylalcohol dehydrogenase [Coniophora puteana RWD-64-598 SS2]
MPAQIQAPVPKPDNRLARYRALAPSASVHVSPLQLGAMSIGDKWADFGFGSMDKESSFRLLDAFYNAGATKYSTNYFDGDTSVKQQQLFAGNNFKSLYLSVEASLKKLRTSYIDIIYLHWWDYETSIEEVMNGLHSLVQQHKVLYLGISDTPAWVVARANQWARDHGKTQFVIYQGAWSVMQRDFEREIVGMARAEGMALAPWNVLAGGKLRTDAEEERRRKTGEKGRDPFGIGWERTETEKKMSAALEKIAKEVGAKHITSVAIAYLLHKTTYVFPIIGGRKIEHMEANIESLSIRLTPEHMKELENAVPFNVGFPYDFFGNGSEHNFIMKAAGWMEKQPVAPPITPELD